MLDWVIIIVVGSDYRPHLNPTKELVNQKLIAWSHFLLDFEHETSRKQSHILTTKPPVGGISYTFMTLSGFIYY